MNRPILTVGFDKGEADYRLHLDWADLSPAQMNEFRAMLVVAIAQAEKFWVDAQMARPENRAYQADSMPPGSVSPIRRPR